MVAIAARADAGAICSSYGSLAENRGLAGRGLRLLRAGILSAVATFHALIAHASSGQQLPSLTTLALVLLAGVAISAPLLGREIGRARVVSLLVGSQVVFHLALVTATEAAEGTSAAALARHLHDHLADESAPANLAMTGAHLLAAALVGLWLVHGERALWSLLALTALAARDVILVFLVTWAAASQFADEVTVRRIPVGAVRPLLQRLLSSAQTRRGPPVVDCAHRGARRPFPFPPP